MESMAYANGIKLNNGWFIVLLCVMKFQIIPRIMLNVRYWEAYHDHWVFYIREFVYRLRISKGGKKNMKSSLCLPVQTRKLT